jgi:hypothetical protein
MERAAEQVRGRRPRNRRTTEREVPASSQGPSTLLTTSPTALQAPALTTDVQHNARGAHHLWPQNFPQHNLGVSFQQFGLLTPSVEQQHLLQNRSMMSASHQVGFAHFNPHAAVPPQFLHTTPPPAVPRPSPSMALPGSTTNLWNPSPAMAHTGLHLHTLGNLGNDSH